MSSPLQLIRIGTALLLAGIASASMGCSGTSGAMNSSHAELVRLSELRSMSDEQWDQGHVLESILTLEYACALVAVGQVPEEGGHDYLIKNRVRELFERRDKASLETILRESSYFPQASDWVVAWATEPNMNYGVPASTLSGRMEITRRVSVFDKKLATQLSPRPNHATGKVQAP